MKTIQNKFGQFIKTNWPYLFLVMIQVFLFAVNYKPGAFLVGWDNLFPELNFSLNLKRAFFAVWQEYRGMGVVDNMSHAATIVEDLERLALSLIMPQSLVRWVYLLGLHLIGALGIYHLLTQGIFKISKKNTKIWYTIASLVAALFYQHNLGVIQQMYLPMEVFVVHFAYLPWLIWSTLETMNTGTKRNYITLGILSFLATPQAHVPTLFIVFAMAIGIVLALQLIHNIHNWKRALLIILTIFITNAFWLIPFTYATITHSAVVANSKAFQMASDDIFYRNHKYGDIKDIALIKGTLLEYNYFNFKANNYHEMFGPWLKHIGTPLFQIPAWTFFVLALIGSVATYIKYKQGRSLAALFIFSIVMLGTNTPVIGSINSVLRENVPLFKVVFRFVFTKFSILYALSFSVLLGTGIAYLAQLIRNISYKLSFFIVIAACLILYVVPSFQGNFFYDNLRVEIPKKYFQTFDFFNKQDPNTRIAMLPTPWYWAWLQPDWGTINSGFFWYAVPQPTTDLAFTPWSDINENFYWELDRAFLLNDVTAVESVLKKYDITWVYLDMSILNSESRKLTYTETDTLLQSSPKIKVAQTFGSVRIYKFTDSTNLNAFVGTKTSLPVVAYSQNYNDFDLYYRQNGDYRKNTAGEVAENIYPYFSVFSGKAPALENIEVKETETQLSLVGKTDLLSADPVLFELPSDINNEMLITNGQGDLTSLLPNYSLTLGSDEYGKSLTQFNIDKKSTEIYNSNTDKWYTEQTNEFCGKNPEGKTEFERLEDNGNVSFKLSSVNSQNCVRIALPGLSVRYGYLVRIEYTADTKRGWFVNFYNETAQKNEIETYLRTNGEHNVDYFILTPSEMYGQGYTIYFNNKSEGVEKITNTLHSVKIYQVPYEQIKNIHIENKPQSTQVQSTVKINSVTHSVPSSYSVQLNKNSKGETPEYLYLSQSYDPGWKAYSIDCKNGTGCLFSKMFPWIFGKNLTKHVLINNWANGWIIPSDFDSNQTIVIVYLPQYLQFAGFAVLIFTLLLCVPFLLSSVSRSGNRPHRMG